MWPVISVSSSNGGVVNTTFSWFCILPSALYDSCAVLSLGLD